MGSLRPEIILVEYWNRDFTFNRGKTRNDIDTYRALLGSLGYDSNIVFYRRPSTNQEGLLVNALATPKGTWGNIVFFCSESFLEASLDWCAGFVSGTDDKGEIVVTNIINQANIVRKRIKASAKAALSNSTFLNPISAPAPSKPYVVSRPAKRTKVEVAVSPNEISGVHGTGVLMRLLLQERKNLITLRSRSTYGGQQDLKPLQEFELPNSRMDRAEVFEQIAYWMRPYDIQSILCVPYFESDLLIALALKALSGAPMALYVMDDNCLFSPDINRELMAEAISTADAVFAISPELRNAYETAFNRKIWVVPPLLASNLVGSKLRTPREVASERKAVMIGNVWSQAWFDQLLKTIEASGWKLVWYAANTSPGWLKLRKQDLERAGLEIVAQPEMDTFLRLISEAPFVVVPSGETDTKAAQAIAKLSLPTRMPFVLATTGTPLLVMGSENNAAAKFVRRFDIGEVSAYDPASFIAATERLISPERQMTIRKTAAKLAPRFDVAGAYDYIIQTARRKGYASQHLFEDLFRPTDGEYSVYRDGPLPPDVYEGFAEIYRSLERLASMGYSPDFVLDVGASTGIWSYYVSDIFPDAKFLLIEPIMDRYPSRSIKPSFIIEHAAASDHPGRATFKVASDGYNSSLISVSDVVQETESIEVNVRTVDQLVAKHSLAGRGVLKIDVQFAEHLVLAGAKDTLANSIDFLVLELTLRPPPQGKSFNEMLALTDELGFVPFDDVGSWRSPKNGILEQKDFLFVRKDFGFIENQLA
jgi:FkbM family methyltransferase